MVEMLAKLMVIVLTKLHRKPFFVLFVLFALYPLTGMYICIIHDDNNGNDDDGNDNDSDNPITGMYNIAFFAIDLFEKLGIGNEQAVAVSSAFLPFFLGEGGSGYIFSYLFFGVKGLWSSFFPGKFCFGQSIGHLLLLPSDPQARL